MSRLRNAFVLGYHGCSAKSAAAILSGEDFKISASGYDWLGPGVYFWEADPRRALEWANERVARGLCEDAAVLGAVIDLGNCLDLTTRENADLLSDAFASLAGVHEAANLPLPQNKNVANNHDLPLRYLDNAVIAHLHETIEEEARECRGRGEEPSVAPFDTVRGLFLEGETLYPGAGFYVKTHTQIVVRNHVNIKGVFKPRPYPVIDSA